MDFITNVLMNHLTMPNLDSYYLWIVVMVFTFFCMAGWIETYNSRLISYTSVALMTTMVVLACMVEGNIEDKIASVKTNKFKLERSKSNNFLLYIASPCEIQKTEINTTEKEDLKVTKTLYKTVTTVCYDKYVVVECKRYSINSCISKITNNVDKIVESADKDTIVSIK